jgi:hypothetical protein
MAFTFIEPFEEGDTQTNTDTGIEYIYHDSAWRVLGPKIEDEFPTLDERYVNKTGDLMSGALSFGQTTTTSKDWIKFLNERKANQTSIVRVSRPYDGDNGVNTDGSTNARGVGGLDIKLMANSDQNRLRIMTGSSAAVETLKITGGGNGKQIHANSSIGLSGGTNGLQTIWAENGIAGHLSYNGTDEDNRRFSWGANKVWIRRECDLGGNKIIGVGDPDPARGQDAANVDFVNTQIADALDGASFDNYVNKTGDTMTGFLKLDNGAAAGLEFRRNNTILGDLYASSDSTVQWSAKNSSSFKITGKDVGGSGRTFFDAKNHNSSGSQGSDTGYRCKIYHLATPTDNYHASNKKYVDDQDKLRVEGSFKITSAGGNYYIQPN